MITGRSFLEGLELHLCWVEELLVQPGIVDAQFVGLEDLDGGVVEALEADDLCLRVQHVDQCVLGQF